LVTNAFSSSLTVFGSIAHVASATGRVGSASGKIISPISVRTDEAFTSFGDANFLPKSMLASDAPLPCESEVIIKTPPFATQL
jgi:hypothetical protein